MKKRNKAFTLVELMIVISIIGVLAITLLPKLQGAQARSRDAGRIASITSVEAVLNTYFSDEGQYPTNTSDTTKASDQNGNGCLSTNDGTVIDSLAGLFKGQKAPLDPHKSNQAASCTTGGSFAYYSIEKDGINNNSYLLVAGVESYQKANLTLAGTAASNLPSLDGTTQYSTVKAYTWGKPATESSNAKLTVYGTLD